MDIKDNELRDLLAEEITSEIKNLANLEKGGKEHTAAVESLSKLYRLNLEDLELEQKQKEWSEGTARQDEELKLKQRQHQQQNVKHWVDAGLTIGGWVAYDIWQRRGYKFELTGAITTPWLRNLISGMAKIPFKK